jgi:hypothetical protein
METLPSIEAAGNLILVEGKSIFGATVAIINLRLVARVEDSHDLLEALFTNSHRAFLLVGVAERMIKVHDAARVAHRDGSAIWTRYANDPAIFSNLTGC